MNQQPEPVDVSVVVPTYGREEVLLDTIELLLSQSPRPREILIVDQTAQHEASTDMRLRTLNDQGEVRWFRLAEPSIPKSMNYGLRMATQPIVLFLDDDISARTDLVVSHHRAHVEFPEAVAVVGQVLQPGETPIDAPARGSRCGLRADLEFPFFSSRGDWVANVMAGNLSVNRDYALKVGGFDENFIGVAYRFETEVARRLVTGGGKIRFCPEASINHLRAERGGTRSTGSHLTSGDPRFGIGDYYFAFLHGSPSEAWRYSFHRLFREVRTRFHMRNPWWIPVKLVGEMRAFWLGLRMAGVTKSERSNANHQKNPAMTETVSEQ